MARLSFFASNFAKATLDKKASKDKKARVAQARKALGKIKIYLAGELPEYKFKNRAELKQ